MKLPFLVSCFGVLVNIFFAFLPSFIFLVWVERGLDYSCFCDELDTPLPWKIVWDLVLFLGFGFLHTALAQKPFHLFLERLKFPLQLVRTLYLMVTGLALFSVLYFWQYTDITVLTWPINESFLIWVSLALFWGFMAGPFFLMQSYGLFYFIGLKQLFMTREELLQPLAHGPLHTNGIYSFIRHPIYSFTLLAFLVTPVMSLDRLILIVAMGIYLYIAIPIEEKKLINLFGDEYIQYRKRVPALIPRLWRNK
jgi:protein-S-isoprenylcysteine O-methyltransferase Ste14